MIKTALVTGATGFVGSHFILNMINEYVEKAFLIVRGEDEEVRLKKILKAFESAASSYIERPKVESILKNVEIIHGDIEKPLCGLSEFDFQRLKDAEIDDVWHFAATLNYEEYRREHIAQQNVDGTKHCVGLAKAIEVKRFLYISTAYTCGVQNDNVTETLHNLDRKYSNFYEESKNNAEHVVVDAMNAEENIELVILRPAVVVGNSQTKRTGGSYSGLYGLIREIRYLSDALKGTSEVVRLFGDPEGQINFIPVDLVIDDIKQLLDQGMKDGDVYHLSAGRNPNTKFLIDSISRALGINNLSFEKKSSNDLSALEKTLEKRMTFYGTYLESTKDFKRSLEAVHDVAEEDLLAYVVEGTKEQKKKSASSVFASRNVTTRDGVHLNVYTAGENKESPVVLINAHAMPVDFFIPLASVLSDKHYIVSWETRILPSTSGSTDCTTSSIENHIDDFEDVVSELGLTSVSVVGWCTGARTAYEIGKHFRDKVSNLVLLNGAYAYPGAEQTDFEKNIRSTVPKAGEDIKYAKMFHNAFFSRKEAKNSAEESSAQQDSDTLLSSTDPELLHLINIPFQNYINLHRYGKLMKPYADTDIAQDEFPSQRALIMTSDQDVTTSPSTSRTISEMIPNAEFFNFEGGDHFSLYKHPRFIAKIDSFLSEEKPKHLNT
jgi:thioester reductase-like protein/pimeloyl-ACP methyl ester carboxylesterase